MVDLFQKKVLMLALYAGEIMMRNGAEIYRVEDTMTHICKACKMDNVEVFLLLLRASSYPWTEVEMKMILRHTSKE